jgi:hypothetical protein
VIFYLNKILIATHFNKCSCTIIFILDWRNSWRNILHNSKSIFGQQPNVTISIIIWIKFGIKYKYLYMLPKCLIKSFACKICISCQINLTNQFSTRTLMFFFLLIYTLMLARCCS